MNSIYIFFVFILVGLSPLTSQRTCGTMDYLENQLQQHPEIEERMRSIEEHTQKKIRSGNLRSVSGLITIPVVVHVVYKNASENISAAQIQSQLDVLNEDFRRMNADTTNTPTVFSGLASDVEVAFCLASVDPFGSATSGITRTVTSLDSIGINDFVKFSSLGGIDAWPKTDYLNLWIGEIGGNTLGYAQFPGGPSRSDGVVIDYKFFGTTGTATYPFDLGRTATHEVGHWLNLRHIWGDGGCAVDDLVSDTPLAGGPNYTGNPCIFPGPNSCNEGGGDLNDMFQNYMDYSDDECMNLFTSGQKTRMRALFDVGGFRESLLTSGGCGIPMPATCSDGYLNGSELKVDCGGPGCNPCPPCTDLLINITFDNYPEETSWQVLNSFGNEVASGGPYVGQADGSTLIESVCLEDGCYDFIIMDSYGDGVCCSYGIGSYSVATEFGENLGSGGDFEFSELINFCLEKKFTFLGTNSNNWDDATSWDKGLVPPSGFDGQIVIASDCIRTGGGVLNIYGLLVINSGMSFIQN